MMLEKPTPRSSQLKKNPADCEAAQKIQEMGGNQLASLRKSIPLTWQFSDFFVSRRIHKNAKGRGTTSMLFPSCIGLSPFPGCQLPLKVCRNPLLNMYTGGDWHPGKGDNLTATSSSNPTFSRDVFPPPHKNLQGFSPVLLLEVGLDVLHPRPATNSKLLSNFHH